MDAIEKTVARLFEWFRTEALEDRIRLTDDNDGTTIGINGQINVCSLAGFLLHGNATHTPGSAVDLAASDLPDEELLRQALQNLPPSVAVKKSD